MKIIYIILLFTFSNIYSQETNLWTKIEFTQILDNEVTRSELYFNNIESIYFFGNKTIVDTTSLNMTIRKTDEIGNAIYKNNRDNKLFTRYADGMQVLKINDNIPILNWTITDEQKKISSINLKKATTVFRGRKYTAWFNENIASSNGPLKMGGLPGLILELTTDDNFLNVTFNRIQELTEKPNNLFSVLNYYDSEMTQKEWVKKSKEQVEEFVKKIKARSGGRDSVTNITIGEALEKEYEWEKEKRK